MRRILVVGEFAGDRPDDTLFELAAAARSLGEVSVAAALLGEGLSTVAAELTDWFDTVHCFDDARLAVPDGDAWLQIVGFLAERERPFATLIAHSNVGMDYAPALAARLDVPMLADCFALGIEEGRLTGTRAMYGGKVHARVAAGAGATGHVVTVRPGAFAPPAAAPDCGGVARAEALPESFAPRRRLVETVAREAGAVDLTQAEVLVAVGRGIEEEENLDLVRSLADALGAELACTRPVVDKGWMEKSRQVGTSGVSVKPRIYLTVGVSGSFQHMGGVKGGPFIAAINKDPAAPIFSVADVGIVGDLLDLVPLLESKIREREKKG